MDRSSLTTAGGVTSAIVASLCCIGPIAVAFMGVGSVGAFAVFDVYRPYLIGLTLIFLTAAFYLTYRRREVMCEDGTCKLESSGKWSKVSVWSASIIAILALSFPYMGIALPSGDAFSNPATDTTFVATIAVEGMDCEACAIRLEGSLSGLGGVRQAKVGFKESQARIDYDPQKITPDAIIERVEQNGFDASIVATPGVAQQTSIMTAILAIEGLDCEPCAIGLQGSLSDMQGVHNVVVEYENARAVIEYDADSVSPTDLVGRVKQNGFTATLTENRHGG